MLKYKKVGNYFKVIRTYNELSNFLLNKKF